MISVNLLLEDETRPVIWRGPVIAGTVKQFWTDVIWGDVDYMFIDCPPGTGDVPLTVFQSIKLDGVIIVTTPQELVSMIVGKSVHMAEMMNIPIIGLVENMSYVKCPDCGREINVFGKSKAEEVCKGIRELIAEVYDTDTAEAVRIQYGGSMNAGNAKELLAKPNIDGGLIGGASLKAEFGQVVNA